MSGARATRRASWKFSRPASRRRGATRACPTCSRGGSRRVVGGAASTTLALLAGIVASVTFALRETAQRRISDSARDDLEAVAEFQAEMLSGLVPHDLGRRLVNGLAARASAARLAAGASPADAEAAAAELVRGALRLAQRACELEQRVTGAELWNDLDTLAHAQDANDDRARAIETERRAIALLPPGDPRAAPLREWLSAIEP